MNAPAFTPGPWFAVNDGTEVHDRETRFDPESGVRVGSTPNLVASVDFTGGRGDRVANANLIAAAPTMYTTLQSIEREGRDANADGDVVIPSEVWDQVRAALAKAVRS